MGEMKGEVDFQAEVEAESSYHIQTEPEGQGEEVRREF